MRAKIFALALASLAASSAFAQTTAQSSRRPDLNPYWTGCVIARQIAPSGATVALDRVCSVPHQDFEIFEPNQFGQRPMLMGSQGPTALMKAELNFVGFLSDFAQGDGRTARLRVKEQGPARTQSSYVYDLLLRVDQEAVVRMPSGYSIGMRMDPTNQPTSYDEALTMPTFDR